MFVDRFSEKVVGLALVFVVLISSYLGVVQIVNGLNRGCLIVETDIHRLGAQSDSNFSSYLIGDRVVVSADLVADCVCFISIDNENGTVYSTNVQSSSGKAETAIDLCAPPFRADEVYLIRFVACRWNFPVLGASETDRTAMFFSLSRTGTRLGLTEDFNETINQLDLSARLENENGSPVANKTIEVSLQLDADSSRMNKGWMPLSNATTDDDGLVKA